MGVVYEAFINAQDSNEAKAVHDQEEVYMEYIKNHKNNVIKAFNKLYGPVMAEYERTGTIEGFPTNDYFGMEEFVRCIKYLIDEEIIVNHDMSKYSDSEFPQYRAHWDPTEKEKQAPQEYTDAVERAYQKAWEHHYQNNNHHPEFWYNFEKKEANDMSLESMLHMMADWASFRPDDLPGTIEWYNTADEEKSFMSEKTKAVVDILLGWLFK